MLRPPPRSTLFPYTTLFRSWRASRSPLCNAPLAIQEHFTDSRFVFAGDCGERSEEHTSELQSHVNLVCRLLLEKKTPNTPLRARHAPARSESAASASCRPCA